MLHNSENWVQQFSSFLQTSLLLLVHSLVFSQIFAPASFSREKRAKRESDQAKGQA